MVRPGKNRGGDPCQVLAPADQDIKIGSSFRLAPMGPCLMESLSNAQVVKEQLFFTLMSFKSKDL